MSRALFPGGRPSAAHLLSVDPRAAFAGIAAAIAALAVLFSFWLERATLPGVLLTALGLGAAYALSGFARRHPRFAAAIALDVALLFAYLWTLDDRIHVVIQAGPTTYVVRAGDETSTLPRSSSGGWIGLYSGREDDYRVQTLGESFDSPGRSFLGRFGEWARFAVPMPAWDNIRVTDLSGRTVALGSRTLKVMSGRWTVNPRGELEGGFGATALFTVKPPRTYLLSADLMRGDGTAGLMLDMNRKLAGTVMAIRLDQPDILWLHWQYGHDPQAVGGAVLHVPPVPALQRALRLILGNIVAGLALLLFGVALFLAVSAALRLIEPRETDDLAPIERIVRPPVLTIAAVLAGVAGVAATAVISTQLLQRIPHVQDSVAYLWQAKMYATGHLWEPIPPLKSFFTEEFIPMVHGRWFSKYPPGWPVLLTLGVLAHAAWLVNPLLSGINLLLVYLIGKEVYGRGTALLATLLLLISPFFLFLGASFMAHTSSLFYLLGFAYLVIRWARRYPEDHTHFALRSWRLLLPAGFLLGMDAMTRELDAVGFALPFVILFLGRPYLQRVLAGAWVVLGALPPVAALLLYNRLFTGSFTTSTYVLWWPYDRIGFGPTIGSYGGFTPGMGFWNTSFNLNMLLAHLFGWPFYLTLAVAALPFLSGRANRWDVLFAASALCQIWSYTSYWTAGVMYGPRYYYVAIGWLALLTARGLWALYQLPFDLHIASLRDRAAAGIVPALLLVLLAAYDLRIYLPAQTPVYSGYNFSSASSLNAVAQRHIHHALVFVVSDPPDEWWSYGEVFPANSVSLDGDIVYARDQGADDRALEALYPRRSYYRLEGTTITRLPAP